MLFRSAVTDTLYVPMSEADLSIVPEIKPVAGSIARPFGRPWAEYVSVSLLLGVERSVLGSTKADEMSSATLAPFALA